jgi:hypothetical protein
MTISVHYNALTVHYVPLCVGACASATHKLAAGTWPGGQCQPSFALCGPHPSNCATRGHFRLCLLPSVTTAWRGDFARHGAGTHAVLLSGKALPAATRQAQLGTKSGVNRPVQDGAVAHSACVLLHV